MPQHKFPKLKYFYVALLSGIDTFYASLRIILASFFSSDSVASVNRILYAWSKRLINLVKIKLRISGEENIAKTERPMIVMCNHSSLYDIPISVLVIKNNLRMMAKKELFKIPVFSAALKRGGFVSVDRQNRQQSAKDLVYAKQKMQQGILLWIAPEGTRAKDGKLARFKSGGFHLAIDSQALILPMVIKDVHKVQPGKKKTINFGQIVEVNICPPIDAADYSMQQREELMQQVRQQMLLALGQDT